MLDGKAWLAVANSSQRFSVGLRSRLKSSLLTPHLLVQVFLDLALCTDAQSCWNSP